MPFAQIDAGLANFIAQNGIAGVLVAAVLWYCWYRETKTIPLMLQTFRDEMAIERQRCDAAIKEERIDTDKIHTAIIARLDEHSKLIRDIPPCGVSEDALAVIRRRREEVATRK